MAHTTDEALVRRKKALKELSIDLVRAEMAARKLKPAMEAEAFAKIALPIADNLSRMAATLRASIPKGE